MGPKAPEVQGWTIARIADRGCRGRRIRPGLGFPRFPLLVCLRTARRIASAEFPQSADSCGHSSPAAAASPVSYASPATTVSPMPVVVDTSRSNRAAATE